MYILMNAPTGFHQINNKIKISKITKEENNMLHIPGDCALLTTLYLSSDGARSFL
jgi:hypothetical protein